MVLQEPLEPGKESLFLLTASPTSLLSPELRLSGHDLVLVPLAKCVMVVKHSLDALPCRCDEAESECVGGRDAGPVMTPMNRRVQTAPRPWNWGPMKDP